MKLYPGRIINQDHDSEALIFKKSPSGYACVVFEILIKKTLLMSPLSLIGWFLFTPHSSQDTSNFRVDRQTYFQQIFFIQNVSNQALCIIHFRRCYCGTCRCSASATGSFVGRFIPLFNDHL